MNKRGGVKGLLCIWAVSLAWTCGSTQPGTDDDAMKYRLHIAGELLEQSLQELAAQSGIQIVFFSKLTEGLRAPALDGLYTITAALDVLLSNSKLTYRMINPKTIQISSRTTGGEDRQAPSRKQASQPGMSVKGSADLEEVAGTRIETPLNAIPQTLTVISAAQIRQQNDTDLTDALRYAPGITVEQIDSINALFYSRGFQITSFHVDGGAALDWSVPNAYTTAIFETSPDLSEFDHIEVLRGSDALFGGTGNPGGTVSLVRKQPLDTFAATADLSTGSWNNERAEGDVTGPLAFNGALRGRLDGVFEDRGYFYNLATLERKRLFGVIEAEVTPATVVRLGGSYQRDDSLPFVNGLPRGPYGSDPHLPVDTALTFDWSRFRERMREGYLQAQQNFAGDWKVKIDAEEWDGKANAYYGYWESTIDPETKEFYAPPSSELNFDDSLHRQFAIDVTVTGTLPWFGRRADFAFGGDFMHVHTTYPIDQYFASSEAPNQKYRYNPALYPSPFFGLFVLGLNPSTYLRTHGVFTSLRIPLTDALSITAGTRLGSDEAREDILLYDLETSFSAWERTGSSNVFTPYAGVMYALDDHYSLYASYADIYQTLAETVEQRDGRLLGPESGVDREIGIKASWRERALNGALIFYRISQDGVPLALPGYAYGNCCFVSGSNRSYGADIEVNGLMAPGWLVTVGYTYNVNEAATGGEVSQATPRHLFKLWTSKQLSGALSRFTIGGGLLAQSANSISGTCTTGEEICLTNTGEYEIVQGSYAVADLRAGVRIDSHWQAALTVNNLFDRMYYQAIGNPIAGNWYGEPRNWQLRIQGKY